MLGQRVAYLKAGYQGNLSVPALQEPFGQDYSSSSLYSDEPEGDGVNV